MNRTRGWLLGVVLCVGLAFLRPSGSFAETEHSSADIKLLRDASAALQQSRPDLATALNTYADREAKELDEASKEPVEKEDMGEILEPKDEPHDHTSY